MAKLKVVTEDIQDEASSTIRDVTVTVEGLTSYSASQHPGQDKQKSETWDDFEARIWKQKAHAEPDEDGEDSTLFIPGVAFKLAIDEATQISNEKIQGKGHQTYTGVMRTGITAISDMRLAAKLSEVKAEKVYCHSNGKRGPGTRVNRWFPIVREWGGEITFRIFNDSITEEKFEEFFTKAGKIAGVGRGRPSTGCPMGNGRFRPLKFRWSRPD